MVVNGLNSEDGEGKKRRIDDYEIQNGSLFSTYGDQFGYVHEKHLGRLDFENWENNYVPTKEGSPGNDRRGYIRNFYDRDQPVNPNVSPVCLEKLANLDEWGASGGEFKNADHSTIPKYSEPPKDAGLWEIVEQHVGEPSVSKSENIEQTFHSTSDAPYNSSLSYFLPALGIMAFAYVMYETFFP